MKGPTKREETAPKLSPRIDYETKIGKVKRMVSASLTKTQTIPTTYDEAKASCKARKRKERQESISSLCQERKVIRSNSEERPAQKKYMENKNNIRRVSSSEDFQKSASIEKINVSPKRLPQGEKTLYYEDCEHERRRSHERFSRPLTLKKKHPNKRLRIRYVSRTKFKPELPTDNKEHKKFGVPQEVHPNDHDTAIETVEVETTFLQLHREERERSPSPSTTPISPVIDLKTLHEQIDCSEPVLSHPSRQINENTETLPSLSVASNRLLSSPRNSIIATHRIYLDPDVPQMTLSLDKTPQNPVAERLQKLTKQINSAKKKIKKYETEFEAKHGFKPSHVEKMNDKTMKKFYTDLNKMRKEQKQLNEVSSNCSLIGGVDTKSEPPNSANLQETINEIEKVKYTRIVSIVFHIKFFQKLAAKRDSANRSYHIEKMSSEELMDEKIAVQKALLYLESIHGRPNNKEDRDVVRPFYDRYRVLKRMVAKLSMVTTANS